MANLRHTLHASKLVSMYAWPKVSVPTLPGISIPLRLYDTSAGELTAVTPGETAGMYVCGITPYDATHLGHAATYVTFDLIYRILRGNSHNVLYVQNVTDVDDPLFERAERDGVDWRELGNEQTDLFRSDMELSALFHPTIMPVPQKPLTRLSSLFKSYSIKAPHTRFLLKTIQITKMCTSR